MTIPTTAAEVLGAILRARVVPIIRTPSRDWAAQVAEVLAGSGLGVIEVTFTVPDAAQVIRSLRLRFPGVLVVHDAQGLTEHFKDIARRLAKAGFVALAPDLASRAGGTDALADPAKVTSALSGMGPGQFLQDLNASVRSLEAHPLVAKTRIGAIGFGMGGNIIWLDRKSVV